MASFLEIAVALSIVLVADGFPLTARLSRAGVSSRAVADGFPLTARHGVGVSRRAGSPLLSAASDDWRDVRARLVAKEQLERQGVAPTDASSAADRIDAAQVYETPLIEQGSVILGGTQQEYGFALRQQYFHKSVMLLLQHDESFTKGIILNRPSAMELDGWRVWFGGDVVSRLQTNPSFFGRAHSK